MIIDPRVTPTNDTTVSRVPGYQDNPALRGLTVDQLGMEVATELGVNPMNLSAYGLSAGKIDQLETQLHSRNSGQNNNNNNR